jgi:hypothetical protein
VDKWVAGLGNNKIKEVIERDGLASLPGSVSRLASISDYSGPRMYAWQIPYAETLATGYGNSIEFP